MGIVDSWDGMEFGELMAIEGTNVGSTRTEDGDSLRQDQDWMLQLPEMAHWRPDEPASDCQLVVCKIFVLFYNEATA